MELQDTQAILETLELGDTINKIMQHPDIIDREPEVRTRMAFERFKDFAQLYPLVLKFITERKLYSTKTFRRYLMRLRDENLEDRMNMQAPTTGTTRTREQQKATAVRDIEKKCMYIYYVYELHCKREKKHMDNAEKQRWYDYEMHAMKKVLDRIQDTEDKAGRQFDAEAQKYNEQRREELFKFIMTINAKPVTDTKPNQTANPGTDTNPDQINSGSNQSDN